MGVSLRTTLFFNFFLRETKTEPEKKRCTPMLIFMHDAR